MNNRIKELYTLAWKEAYNVDPSDPRVTNAHKVMKEGFEKFAELIIKECIEQCEKVAQDANDVAESKFVTETGRTLHQGVWGGAKNCVWNVKEHFGMVSNG